MFGPEPHRAILNFRATRGRASHRTLGVAPRIFPAKLRRDLAVAAAALCEKP
jgi:hypothetical protein